MSGFVLSYFKLKISCAVSYSIPFGLTEYSVAGQSQCRFTPCPVFYVLIRQFVRMEKPRSIYVERTSGSLIPVLAAAKLCILSVGHAQTRPAVH